MSSFSAHTCDNEGDNPEEGHEEEIEGAEEEEEPANRGHGSVALRARHQVVLIRSFESQIDFIYLLVLTGTDKMFTSILDGSVL